MSGHNLTRQGPDGRERCCSACEAWKPETQEHYFLRTRPRKNGSLYQYFYSKCRECHSESYRSDGIAVGQHAEDPSLWYPDTSNNPGTPIYEAPACEALRARFGF